MESRSDPREDPAGFADGVLVVRRGPGANCSSIGSAVEMLFLSATVGAAVLAAIAAALDPAQEPSGDSSQRAQAETEEQP
jgi:hypothetical protein